MQWDEVEQKMNYVLKVCSIVNCVEREVYWRTICMPRFKNTFSIKKRYFCSTSLQIWFILGSTSPQQVNAFTIQITICLNLPILCLTPSIARDEDKHTNFCIPYKIKEFVRNNNKHECSTRQDTYFHIKDTIYV